MSQVGYGKGDCLGFPYDYYVPLTGFVIQMQTGVLLLNPAGTLATGTVTLPQSPPDGALVEISSTRTQTALTLNAGTGDSIANGGVAAVTALTLGVAVRYRYSLNGDTLAGVNPRSWIRVS